jgi:hypothetical protein
MKRMKKKTLDGAGVIDERQIIKFTLTVKTSSKIRKHFQH